MNPSEQFAIAALILTPVALIIIIALLKGYHIHLTKHRITEHKKDKDE